MPRIWFTGGPAPSWAPQDEERQKKLQKIKKLLRDLPPGEIAVFEDEVDINTNPKIGRMWMLQGQQAEVVNRQIITEYMENLGFLIDQNSFWETDKPAHFLWQERPNTVL